MASMQRRIACLTAAIGLVCAHETGAQPRVSTIRTPYGSWYQASGFEGDLRESARRLVVMLEARWAGVQQPEVGAGVMVGQDDGCLYVVTADHVVRRQDRAADQVSSEIRTWPTPLVGRVLQQHDAQLDLGVVCLPMPEKTLVPFPRVLFARLGSPELFGAQEPLFHIGRGQGVKWRENVEPARLLHADGDFLELVASISGGDSGGGVFCREVYELAGIVVESPSVPGRARVLSINAIVSRLKSWKIPVGLSMWDYEAVTRESSGASERTVAIAMDAPPASVLQGDRAVGGEQRLMRLLVGLANPSISMSGVIVGATSDTVVVATSARFVAGLPATAQKAVRMTLWQQPPTDVVAAAVATADDLLLLSLPIPLPDGERAQFVRDVRESLLFRYAPAAQLARGTILTHLGAGWALNRSSTFVVSTNTDWVQVSGAAIPQGDYGGGVFNDRYELVGILTGRAGTDLKAVTTDAVVRRAKEVGLALGLTEASVDVRAISLAINGRVGSPSSLTWARTYGGGASDRFKALATLPNGTLVAAGSTRSFGAGAPSHPYGTADGDGWLLTPRRDGTIAVSAYSSDPRLDRFDAVAASSHDALVAVGNVIVDSGADASSSYKTNGYLAWITPEGRVARRVEFGDAAEQMVWSAAAAAGPNRWCLAGRHVRQGTSVGALLAVAGGDGKVLWSHVFERETDAFAVAGAEDGSCVVAGTWTKPTQASAWFARTDPAGQVLWQQLVTTLARNNGASGVWLRHDGSVAFTGSAAGQGQGSMLLVGAVSATGKLWSLEVGRVGAYNRGASIQETVDGGLIIAGSISPTTGPESSGWLVRMSGAGTLEWQKVYDLAWSLGSRRITFEALRELGDGCIAIAGYAGHFSDDGLIIVVSASGEMQNRCRP
jgi:hypothetical protein